MERITINLDLEPKERWFCLKPYREEVNVLIETYLSDLEDASFFGEAIEFYKSECINPIFLEELSGISSFTKFSVNDLLMANLYYDALKLVFGCSAFSVNTKDGNLHARNLDWWSDNNSLKDFTKVFDFKKENRIIFSSVGWPGFIGVFSGLKPQRYAITLNAVLSQDLPEFAHPITFKIREVFENENSFLDAVENLENNTIASDCLLLVTGVNKEERVVIERIAFKNKTIEGDVLQESSCGRQNRVIELLNTKKLEYVSDCFKILNDEKVKMSITMQQMVFSISKGTISLKE